MQGNAEQRSVPPLEIVERESGGDDVFTKLEDISTHPAKKWTAKAIPKDANPDEWIVSDKVSGLVEYLEDRLGDHGPYIAAELRQKSGERIQVAGFGTVLDGWFRIFRVGDGVAIMYHGTKPSPKPGYEDYDVFEVIVVRDGRRVSKPREASPDKAPESGALPMASDA